MQLKKQKLFEARVCSIKWLDEKGSCVQEFQDGG
jgi:hypothetical protein